MQQVDKNLGTSGHLGKKQDKTALPHANGTVGDKALSAVTLFCVLERIRDPAPGPVLQTHP